MTDSLTQKPDVMLLDHTGSGSSRSSASTVETAVCEYHDTVGLRPAVLSCGDSDARPGSPTRCFARMLLASCGPLRLEVRSGTSPRDGRGRRRPMRRPSVAQRRSTNSATNWRLSGGEASDAGR
jgi:hypothetical protein